MMNLEEMQNMERAIRDGAGLQRDKVQDLLWTAIADKQDLERKYKAFGVIAFCSSLSVLGIIALNWHEIILFSKWCLGTHCCF